MALAIGNNAMKGAYLGTNQVRRAYKGGTLVYQGFGPAEEQEFIQKEATGGPAKLLKVYGKTIVDVGSLQSNKTTELRAERIPVINVWDEEWEFGRYDTNTGKPTENATMLRNKNRISISPNSTYYVAQPGGRGLYLYIYFYDLEGNFIGKMEGITPNRTFTPTAEAAFMNFFYYKAGGLTTMPATSFYFSNPAINGTYYPHWRGSLQLNLATLTGKLNGEGASVVVFPDGLRGVGTDRDAAYGSTGEVARAVVDLGTLNWGYSSGFFYTSGIPAAKTLTDTLICPGYVNAEVSSSTTTDKAMKIYGGSPVLRVKDSAYSDPATFKAAMSGVMLDYPLATPLTYTLDTPLPTDLTCEQGDKLQRVSDNNCPFVGEMRFGL